MFPADNERCAWKCPTISAVNKSNEIVFSEESLRLEGHPSPVTLGVAVIPLQGMTVSRAQAVLVLRTRGDAEEAAYRSALLADAAALRKRIESHLGASDRPEAR